MTPVFGMEFKNTKPLTDDQIRERGYDGDEMAWNHFCEHTAQQPAEDCPHCYWVGWLAVLDPFAERVGQC